MTGAACRRTQLLGGYALGSLEPEDRAAVDGHLLDCPACAAELGELQGLVPLLAGLTLDDVTALSDVRAEPSPDLFDRVSAAVDVDRSLSTRRRRLVAVAAAVSVAGIAAGVGVVLTGGTATLPSYQASAGRVHMGVVLDARPTGTELRVSVTGVRNGEHCRLVAVSTDGTRQVAGSWVAAYDGRAQVTTSTSLQPGQLADLVLFGTHGRHLVTVATT